MEPGICPTAFLKYLCDHQISPTPISGSHEANLVIFPSFLFLLLFRRIHLPVLHRKCKIGRALKHSELFSRPSVDSTRGSKNNLRLVTSPIS